MIPFAIATGILQGTFERSPRPAIPDNRTQLERAGPMPFGLRLAVLALRNPFQFLKIKPSAY